jgi:SAM-dependent methyltransferase
MAEESLSVDQLQELLWSFATHRVITVAGRTGILTRLARDECTVEEVAAELDLDPLACGKMVRALSALGLVEARGERYRLGALLAPRFQGGDLDLVPFLEHSHSMYERWGESLEPWVRGEPWKTKARDPDGVARFGAAMQAMGGGVARVLTERLDCRGVSRILDVGGGLGHYARAFLEALPQATAAVLDIPEVAELGRVEVAGTALEDRLEFVAGDYVDDDYGAGYDLTLLANVLHQEKGDRPGRMVRKGAASLAPGGRLVVVDFAIDDERRGHVLGCLFAINMRSFGDTYPEPTIRGWMTDAGLVDVERIDLSSYRWAIVGRAKG